MSMLSVLMTSVSFILSYLSMYLLDNLNKTWWSVMSMISALIVLYTNLSMYLFIRLPI